MQWYKLVQKYTRRSLAFNKDMLPALSGLARAVHTRTNTKYAAGVWIGDCDTTIACLLWQPVREAYDGVEPRVPTASMNGSPSWSWTSLIAEIEHPLADADEE